MKSRNHSEEWQKRKLKVYNKANKLRELMRKALGEICTKCGTCLDLSFHHPHGRDWEPNKKNLMQRMRLYYRDFLQGKIELLCTNCNSIDGAINKNWYREVKNEPKANPKAK
jgi:hypothetical protein